MTTPLGHISFLPDLWTMIVPLYLSTWLFMNMNIKTTLMNSTRGSILVKIERKFSYIYIHMLEADLCRVSVLTIILVCLEARTEEFDQWVPQSTFLFWRYVAFALPSINIITLSNINFPILSHINNDVNDNIFQLVYVNVSCFWKKRKKWIHCNLRCVYLYLHKQEFWLLFWTCKYCIYNVLLI